MIIRVVQVDRNNIVVSRETATATRVTAVSGTIQNITLSQSPVLKSFVEDYVGDVRYIGAAVIATAQPSAPLWRIRQVNITTGQVLSAAADTFSSVWDDRALLQYA